MVEYLSLKKVNDLHNTAIGNRIKEVVDSGWYLNGKATRCFEEHYAEYIGTECCVCCGNGLDALILILRAYKNLGILHDGDEVIVPANTYIATILSITENNLKPVLVEPRYDTLEIDDDLIEQNMSSRTKAVLLVHLYGRCAMTEKIADCCKRNGILLIEDNAQAHGCRYGQLRTGAIGDAAAHSFYPGKNLGALGDAGAVTTNNVELADMVRALGNYGSSRKYVFPYKGLNSRIDEVQAAVLDVKLPFLDEENARRKEIARRYYKEICNTAISLPIEMSPDSNVYHIFPVFCNKRDDLQKFLLDNGVQTMIHYPIPPHLQDCYSEWGGLALPVTERIHNMELSLPCNPVMTEDDVNIVVEAVNRFKVL